MRSLPRAMATLLALTGMCLTGHSAAQPAAMSGRTGDVTEHLELLWSRGRNIYVSLFAQSIPPILKQAPNWPQPVGYDHPQWQPKTDDPADRNRNRVFTTSTEFFQWTMDAQIINVPPSYFSSSDSEEDEVVRKLEPSENAWCVAVGISEKMPEGMPALVTRNCVATNFAQLTGPIRDSLDSHPPLGTNGLLMIFIDGNSLKIQGEDLDQRWEDVLHMGNLTNTILRP